jgi:hypothetical protein
MQTLTRKKSQHNLAAQILAALFSSPASQLLQAGVRVPRTKRVRKLSRGW